MVTPGERRPVGSLLLAGRRDGDEGLFLPLTPESSSGRALPSPLRGEKCLFMFLNRFEKVLNDEKPISLRSFRTFDLD
jgi:hypothetical protein